MESISLLIIKTTRLSVMEVVVVGWAWSTRLVWKSRPELETVSK